MSFNSKTFKGKQNSSLSYIKVSCVIYTIALCIALICKPRFPFRLKDAKNTKYILDWNLSKHFLGPDGDNSTFVVRNCPRRNCIITKSRDYFGPNHVDFFDAVLFYAPLFDENTNYPRKRKPYQHYIFVSDRASCEFSMCDYDYPNFYNWTWTYRLNSNLSKNYMTIRDTKGNIIGPKEEMHWVDYDEIMKSTLNKNVKSILMSKTRVAAWIQGNSCVSVSKRETIIVNFMYELGKLGLSLDVYGSCMSLKKCYGKECLNLIKQHYFFYFAFEAFSCEDFVTDELLKALNHYAIPVVFGGANYTRFMPDGIYLDAKKHSAKELARQMFNILYDRHLLYNYFKWHNFYTYHHPREYTDSDPYCALCAALNDEEFTRKPFNYERLTDWWNHPRLC